MTQQEIDNRIKELEAECKKELESTPNLPIGKPTKTGQHRITTHSQIKQKYTKLIRRLQRYGTEGYVPLTEEQKQRKRQTNIAKYGSPAGNIAKTRQTKMQKYGHMFGNIERIKAVKLERYGNYMGNVDKLCQTKLAKYGSIYGKNAVENAKQTKLERYGSAGWNMHVATLTKLKRYGNKMGDVSKMLQTKIERYGNKWGNVEASLQTKLKRYGNRCGNINKIKQVKIAKYGNAWGSTDKILQTKLKRYGNLIGIDIDKFYAKYGVKYPCQLPQCVNATTSISKVNKSWQSYLASITGKQVELEFPLGKYKFDLKIDNLLIEINPTFTHNYDMSFSYLRYHAKGAKNSHLPIDWHFNKMQVARKHGYDFIAIFDWDDAEKVASLIKSKLQIEQTRIFARKCDVKMISLQQANEFQSLHHLQGGLKSQQHCIGLFYNDELVQVMTFGSIRSKKLKNANSYELLRVCSKQNTQIVGGTSKLFMHFVKQYLPQTVISYCDLSKFDGTSYDTLGFALTNVSFRPHWCRLHPRQKYAINYVLDVTLQKHGVDRLFGTLYGMGNETSKRKRNEQLMLEELHFVRVYDCGQALYVWHAK